MNIGKFRWVKVDEAAKDWTKKLAELSGMWSKQTGTLVLWYSGTGSGSGTVVPGDRYSGPSQQVLAM